MEIIRVGVLWWLVDDSVEGLLRGSTAKCSPWNGSEESRDGAGGSVADDMASFAACESYQNSESTVWVACLMLRYCPKKYGGNGGSVGVIYSCFGI